MTQRAEHDGDVGRWGLVSGVMLGTLLNPLNSSTIAVVLTDIEHAFHASVVETTWLISAFYLAGAVGQPLMGRLADQFGPRRMLVTGLTVVGIVSTVAPLAPNLVWLVIARVVLAAGTSVAFPAAMTMFRAYLPGGAPQSALGAVAAANSASAAFGPVLGGLLVQIWGWQATFLINLPLAAAGIAAALWRLPRVPGAARRGSSASLLRELDLPGIGLFTVALVALLALLLSLGEKPNYALIPVCVLGGIGLVVRELRTVKPFVDIRMLAANRALLGVYVQYASVNVVFYSSFYGVPLWLEQSHGQSARLTGLLFLPLGGTSMMAMPLASWLIRRFGVRTDLLIGSCALLAGSLGLELFGPGTTVLAIVGLSVLLGLPNAFNNLGLQSALYEAAPRETMGTAAGLFQTSRYLGSILSSSVIGLVFAAGVGTAALHRLATIMAALSVLLIVANLGRLRRPRPGSRPIG